MLIFNQRISFAGIACVALLHGASASAQQPQPLDSARGRERISAMLAERIESAHQELQAAAAAPEKAAAEEVELLARGEEQLARYDELVHSGKADHTIEALRRVGRDELAKVSRRALVRTWGPALGDEKAPGELRDHARRVALLKRIRFLAKQEKAASLVARADELMERESARHQLVMQSLAKGAQP